MTDLSPDELQLAFHDVECATYDERFGIAYDERTAVEADREVRRLVGGGGLGRTLDVGCGTGYLGLGLAAAGRVEGPVHLVDLSPGMLERARANAERLGVETRIVRATAAELPYPDGAFDTIVTRGVLHHLHDPVAAMSEWRRVVRPGGPVIVLSEPTPHADRVGGAVARATLRGLDLARRAGETLGRPLSRHPESSRDEHRFWDLVAMAANLHTFTPTELAELGRESGFARSIVQGAGMSSIAWAAAYYVSVGELPDLARSDRAKRRASRVWALLRRLDATVVDRVLPDGVLLTVQAVYSD